MWMHRGKSARPGKRPSGTRRCEMTVQDQVCVVRAELASGDADAAREDVREYCLDGELGSRLMSEIQAYERGSNQTD